MADDERRAEDPPSEEPIRMVKMTAIGKGAAPVGDEVYVLLPMRLNGEWSDTERRHRAWRIFGRDRPDENPMDWEMTDG